eukprot:CAMPEP_0113290420 /NCGR_PEP_ID=MMETSP0008_2-20120614/33430_1 /TAXON_ID=97485 /ORGANISM="Prymnesium parvum" /LENGTH=58 /DNA_ID=CAMNT_0000142113 /DNA_START=184 /DNA_END=360 /DNA_ORIENTATION=+ /assembly_acc=CAM_ASM_000153
MTSACHLSYGVDPLEGPCCTEGGLAPASSESAAALEASVGSVLNERITSASSSAAYDL